MHDLTAAPFTRPVLSYSQHLCNSGYRYPVYFLAGRYEPEIAKFVKEHGDALSIPKSPCTAEQEKWESIAAQKRKQ